MVASPTDSSIDQIRARLSPRVGRSRGDRPGADRLFLVVLALVGIAVVGISLIRGASGNAGNPGTVTVSNDPEPGPGTTPGSVEEGDDPAAGGTGRDSASSTSAQPMRVHVAGAVANPGVYALPPGAIGDEAIAAAGGALVEADLGRVNLAGRLADGQQFYVPRAGEAIPDVGAGGGDPTGAAGGSVAAAPVNINTAGVAALDGLPGIGAATAQKIVEYRTKHGPFADVRQLLDVPGIGEGKFAALEGQVTV